MASTTGLLGFLGKTFSMRRLVLLAALLVALPAGAVTMDWVYVGDPGNPPDADANCSVGENCGSVAYGYYIAKYEVTNSQYAEFLNAVAFSDPLGLYHEAMSSDPIFGGITRSGSVGSYIYTAKAGFENKPVDYVSFWAAVRFANWLHNDQGGGDTETGAYTVTEDGIADNTITRNPGAKTFLPSEDEWYKAAYYSPGGTYFEFPTGENTGPSCVVPASDTGNSANCQRAELTDVGAYGLSASPYGTFDQGGNVWEWNDTIAFPVVRGLRGGGAHSDPVYLRSVAWTTNLPADVRVAIGFRVATLVPEPAQVLLALTGGLVLAAVGRQRCA